MEQSEEGLRILRDRPRITSRNVDLQKLKTYPEGTLGKAYSTFLEVNVRIRSRYDLLITRTPTTI